MATRVTPAEGRRLGLPGRSSLEIVSHEKGARAVTLRRVEIPAPRPGEAPRAPHWHDGFEECIHVLSGRGTTHAESGEYALEAGDTILIPAGERHVTRNTGSEPLVLLCFFPVADISRRTHEGA